MSDFAEIRRRIGQIAAVTTCYPGETLTDAPLAEQGVESLDLIELSMNLEDEWGIHIEDDQLEQLKTLDDWARHVAGKIGVAVPA